MLSDSELQLAIDVADNYPQGIRSDQWGHGPLASYDPLFDRPPSKARIREFGWPALNIAAVRRKVIHYNCVNQALGEMSALVTPSTGDYGLGNMLRNDPELVAAKLREEQARRAGHGITRE